MHIISPLQTGIFQKSFSYTGDHFCCISLLWAFRLADGEAVLQEEMWQALAPLLNAGRPFDYGMPKERAEFLCLGDFHAPGGEAVTQGGVSVTVAGQRKQLAVCGPRTWTKGGLPSRPQPITEMPIRYDHAFGGPGFADNPIGTGYRPDETGAQSLPLIEYPEQPVTSPDDSQPPASLEPVDLAWQRRQKLAGTYDEEYLRTRMPGLPDDVDWRAFNDAPSDQWLETFPSGGEPFEVVNMHPQRPHMQGRLPRVRGRAFVDVRVDGTDGKAGLEFREIPLRLDTVWLLPGAELGIIIHRGTTRIGQFDGTDVIHIMGAHEGLDDPLRPKDHYRHQMERRTDPEEGFRYLLDTRPLLPIGCPCALQAAAQAYETNAEDAVRPNIENFADQQQEQGKKRVQGELDAARASLDQQAGSNPEGAEATHGIDQAEGALASTGRPAPDTTDMPEDQREIQAVIDRALPRDAQGNIDLQAIDLDAIDEIEPIVERQVEKRNAEARDQLLERVDEIRARGAEVPAELQEQLDRLEQIISGAPETPPLTRPNLDTGALDEFEKQVAAAEAEANRLRGQGVSEIDLKGRIPDVEEMKGQLEDLKTVLADQYRESAHLQGEAVNPHPGEEGQRRDQLLGVGGAAPRCDRDYAFIDLSGREIRGLDLSEALLEYADLTGATLVDVNLDGAVLSRARLHDCRFERTSFRRTNLGATSIRDAVFESCAMEEVILGRARIQSSHFRRCTLLDRDEMFFDTEFDGVVFENSNLHDATFFDHDLTECAFRESDLSDAVFVECRLSGADLASAKLSKASFITCPLERARFDRACLQGASFIDEPQLNDATFTDADVSRANLRDADLAGADFRGARIVATDFSGADLTGARLDASEAVEAQFMGSDLTRATLSGANLFEASMLKARLVQAVLRGANLYSVSFLHATLGETDFTGANLDNTILRDWRPSGG